MKRVKGFLSGIILGATATFYGIWHWEKSNRKRISTVADKYYDKALAYANNLIAEYGPEAKKKISEILTETKVYLKDTLKLSKQDIDKIMAELKQELYESVEQIKEKVTKALPKKRK